MTRRVAGVAQLVEYELPKLGVASSNLVARSLFFLVLLGSIASSPALAQEPAPLADDWWVGLPIAGVQILAGAGSLPDESLAPLLHARQGEPLNPRMIRDDLGTLFQVGEFAAVEADATPGMTFDASGEPLEAVQVSYRVYPAPRVRRIRIAGNQAFSDRELFTAAGLTSGQVFYAELRIPQVQSRLTTWLARRGYPDATVDVTVTPTDGELDLTVTVTEGAPNLLEKLVFAGDLDVLFPAGNTKALVRWSRKAGVAEGRPLSPDAIPRAQQEIRARLADMGRPLFGRRRGWIQARVTPAAVVTEGGRQVTFTIEPGARLELDISGIRSLRADRKVRTALAIDDRLRLTRGFLDEAPERLATSLQEQGFLDATAQVTIDAVSPRVDRLVVRVEQGAKHKLKRGQWPNRVGAVFSGNDRIPTGHLQAVLEQSSGDVLRRGYYTPRAMEQGLAAAEAYYGANGYQDATLEETGHEIDYRRGWFWRAVWSPVREIGGFPAVMQVRPVVAVDEGDLTVLATAVIAGAAPDVDLSALEAELAAMQLSACAAEKRPEPGCGAFSPQALEALSRRLIDAHRAAGYLDVEARVSHAEGASPTEIAATLHVDPGAKVLLRSVVTRGLRLVRPEFVRRQVELRLGEPLTSADLVRIRDDLYKLSAFRTVQLDLLGDEAARDLVIGVTERAPWAFEAGAGLSTDQGTRLFGRVTRRNLWYTAQRVELYAQVGLDWLSESALDWRPDWRNPDYRAALTYTAPRFPLHDENLIVDVLLRERLAERTWRMARTGGGPALSHHFDFGLDLRLGARFEARQLQEVDLGALLDGEPWEEILTLIDTAIPTAWRYQDSAQLLAVLDRRDNPLAPSRGFVVQATGEYAPGLVDALTELPTVQFVKVGGRASAYIPLLGFRVRLSAEAGRAIGFGGTVIPLEDRYRLGGTNSLRGFARDTVGPRSLAPRVDVDFPEQIQPILDYTVRDDASRWVPTGGDTSALGVVELEMPWVALGATGWEGWSTVVFGDFGNAWLLSPYTTVDTNDPKVEGVPLVRSAVGTGMRVATPVGPLQLDLASNLDALLSTGARQDLLVNEWEEPAFRAHLTLGALW